MDTKVEWARNYSRDDLNTLCNVLSNQNEKLIQQVTDLEEEIRGIIDTGRSAYALRNTDVATGLANVMEAIKQMKDRCEKRRLDAQMKRSAEAMKEIEEFRKQMARPLRSGIT